jgi:hypothetical protein
MYMGPAFAWKNLLLILCKAINKQQQTFRMILEEDNLNSLDIASLELCFWEKAVAGGREPDLLIKINCKDDQCIYLLIEIKFKMKHQSSYDGNLNPNQLKSQFRELVQKCEKEYISPNIYHFYITRWNLFDELHDSTKVLSKVEVNHSWERQLFWIDWGMIKTQLGSGTGVWAQNMFVFLGKIGISSFDGFECASKSISLDTWQYANSFSFCQDPVVSNAIWKLQI